MSANLTPVCTCGRFMVCRRQNVRVLTHTVHDQPDALYAGVEYGCVFDGECPMDQQQCVTLTIGSPVAEHWQGDTFTKTVGQARGQLVNARHRTAEPSTKTAALRDHSARMETHAPSEASTTQGEVSAADKK